MLAPTRDAGLSRLRAFAPRMGRAYAAERNTDRGPQAHDNVSVLSPHVRHRLLTEEELVAAALAAHGPVAAEKFIQEVFWRTYWKGFLEQRPGIWTEYRQSVALEQRRVEASGGLRDQVAAATEGRTGIDCFDAWVAELRTTGFLHNHARMWFASIWIFTLRLPWVLGADFFLRHLLDGDPASNTLSWRWVGGLHTRGKHYVARAANIVAYTDGRFDPHGALAQNPEPLMEPEPEPARSVPAADEAPALAEDVALLLHEDDLLPETLPLGQARVRAVGLAGWPEDRSPLGCAEQVSRFTAGALADAGQRAARHFGAPATLLARDDVVAWALGTGCATIIVPWAPVGPMQERLDPLLPALQAHGLRPRRLRRAWDSLCWPHARRGFFNLRQRIPDLLQALAPRAAG